MFNFNFPLQTTENRVKLKKPAKRKLSDKEALKLKKRNNRLKKQFEKYNV